MWPGQLFRSDHFVWEGWQMAASFGFLSADVGGSSGPRCGKLQCHNQCLPTGWAVATGTELVWGTKQSATSRWLKRAKRDSIRFGRLCSPKSNWLFFNHLQSIPLVLESAIWAGIEESHKKNPERQCQNWDFLRMSSASMLQLAHVSGVGVGMKQSAYCRECCVTSPQCLFSRIWWVSMQPWHLFN